MSKELAQAKVDELQKMIDESFANFESVKGQFEEAKAKLENFASNHNALVQRMEGAKELLEIAFKEPEVKVGEIV